MENNSNVVAAAILGGSIVLATIIVCTLGREYRYSTHRFGERGIGLSVFDKKTGVTYFPKGNCSQTKEGWSVYYKNDDAKK